MPQVRVSVVILTWNSRDKIVDCLRALEKCSDGVPCEIILIDNGSHDDTVRIIKSDFPAVTLVLNSENRGVAIARNQGIRIAKGEYILFLDDDTEVMPNAIDSLVNYLDNDSSAAIVAPKLIGLDGRLQYSCRKYPTLLSKLARRMPFRLAKRLLDEEMFSYWDHSSVRHVDYVIGACQLIRRKAINQVGLLDERMFYGPEDIDYCIRMAKARWSIVYNPVCVIVHREQRITAKILNKISFYHLIAIFRFFIKHQYLFSRERLYRTIKNAQQNAEPPTV